METLPPICASCRGVIRSSWKVMGGREVWVICDRPDCERWARGRGCSFYSAGRIPWVIKPRPIPRPKPAPPDAYLPSPDVVENARSAGGGWAQSTLHAWGVPWPPPAGWKAALERRWRESQA